MTRAGRTLAGTGTAVIALLCFAGALVVGRLPVVPGAAIPEAADVRAAVEFAQLGENLVATQQPIEVQMPQRWFTGVHRLVGHAKDKLAMDGQVDGRGATFRVSKRVMRHGWLNLAFRLEERADGGVPALTLYAGGWRSPDMLTALMLRIGLPLLGSTDSPLATMSDVIPRFRVEGDTIFATARLPKNLIGGLQAALSPGSGAKVDMVRVRALYGDLLSYVLLHPDDDYAQVVRHVAVQVEDQEGLKAAVVALTMLADGPRVRRLAGERTPTPPCSLEAQRLILQGREDLPKHWTISAALALFMNQRTARAVGLWKELDDSLPGGDGMAGGSGFSFVDLGADTGGVALGLSARNGTATGPVLDALRKGDADVLLPPGVLRLPEGVPLARYKQDYGGLDQPRMLQAEAGIRQILRQSPLYGPLLSDVR